MVASQIKANFKNNTLALGIFIKNISFEDEDEDVDIINANDNNKKECYKKIF